MNAGAVRPGRSPPEETLATSGRTVWVVVAPAGLSRCGARSGTPRRALEIGSPGGGRGVRGVAGGVVVIEFAPAPVRDQAQDAQVQVAHDREPP